MEGYKLGLGIGTLITILISFERLLDRLLVLV